MDRNPYKTRDYDLGRVLLTLRNRIRMTQAELATLAGVSRRSIQIWEGGEGYPKEDRLSRLIAVFLEYGAFTPGRERTEAEDLWQRVDEHAPQRLALFDANWFDQLLVSLQKATTPVAPTENAPLPATPSPVSPNAGPRVDWGEAVDVPAVYGRDTDIATLNEWAIQNQARVVALLGMGGIGKTTLAVAFARQAVPQFEAVVFRSLRNAPPLGPLLDGLIRFVANDQQITLPTAVADKLAMLAVLLREHRCLVVLDNLETIMQEGLQAGLFRTGYADYGTLIQLLGETAHRSCLLLTSREKPRELGPLEGRSSPVHTLPLSGLTQAACKDVLAERGLRGSDTNWLDLTRRYGGNPLALKLVSEPIREIFGGDISAFLSSEGAIFGGIRYLLDQQFQRLSPIELDALYWLAIGREPTSMQTLRAQSTLTVGPRERIEALEALRRRFLIERNEGALFSLQPVILEYITEQLIELFQDEIVGGELRVLRSHAVLQTQVPAYVRQSQIRLLVQPLLARLINSLKTPQNVEQYLGDLLSSVRALPMTEQGYGGGNILNMLIHLGRALRGYDFSAMNAWQAYLADVELPDVDFSRSDLTGALFTETFKTIVPVAFSPDGQFLAAGSVNGEIWLWRIADRQQIGLLSGHVGPVNGLAWSPNGQFLASAGSDAQIVLWAMPAGVQLSSLSGHSGRVWSTAFSPDGSMLVSGGDDRMIRVWSVASGESTLTLHGHQAAVASVAWHPDGSTIASASHAPEPVVKLWSVASGENTATLTGHTADIWSVVWSPDGSMLASGSADHTLKLWSVNGGVEVATLVGHTARIRSLAWSANGKLIASGGLDQATKIWDTASLTCVATLSENTGPVNGIAFAPDSDTVASGGELQTIVLWSASRQESLATLHGYNSGILTLAFNANGTVLASAGFDRTVRLWSLEQRAVLSRFDGHTAAIYSLAFSPDSMLLVSGSGGLDHTVRLWSVAGTAQLTNFEEHTGPVMAVAWSHGQRVIASGSLDCSIKLWSPTSSASLATLNGHEDAVRAIALSSNGAMLASGSYDRTVRLWSVEQRAQMATYEGHTAPVRVVAWKPDDRLLASGGADHTVRLWDVTSGSEIAVLEGHNGEIPALAWSPDGTLLASGSFDGSIRLWNVANQTLDVVLNPETGVVYALAWSPDGQLLASGGAEGVITLWHVASRTPVATLRSEGPYARMRITGARGLTDAQKATLRLLGAVEDAL